MTRTRRLAAWTLGVALLGGPGGCRSDDGTQPVGTTLPPLTVRDDTKGLLLTWIDARGETHTALAPAEVPAGSRDLVRVVLADREDGTRDPFYVLDLAHPEADGGYRAKTMARREWEAILAQRRGGPAPPGKGPPAGGAEGTPPIAAGAPLVVIYGASWCRPCHDAADYLKSIGVPYLLKDVDEDEGARREMREKLARAGGRGGSIPVIDVRGEIIVGYNRGALDQALAKAKGGTAL